MLAVMDTATTRFIPLSSDDPAKVSDYVLQAKIGTGGMGTVYLSFTRGGLPIAIKLVKPDLAADPEFRYRFAREIAVARRVQGPYTASVVDADPDAEIPWFASTYIAGPSLQKAVSDYGPLPRTSVFRMLAGAAEGIQAMHKAGLIHRDLTPANLLLAEGGPRLIDFGIARAVDSPVTSPGILIGTPGYMAPEQIHGQVSPATDVFGLGQLALYAATAHTAFGKGSSETLLERTINEQPSLTGCPSELRPIVEACLRRDPGRRPTVTQVIDYAHDALQGQRMRAITEPWLPLRVTATFADYAPPPPPPPPATDSMPSAQQPAMVGASSPRRRLSRTAIIVAVALLIGAGGFIGYLAHLGYRIQRPGSAAADLSKLLAGQQLRPEQHLVSPNNQYTMTMQANGDLVVRGDNCTIWSSGTSGNGSYLSMQGDGNLVIYGPSTQLGSGPELWQTSTVGTGSRDYLALEDDGNAVLYNGANDQIYPMGRANADRLCAGGRLLADQTLYSSSEQYRLVMQTDGNLVAYNQTTPIWSSQTNGKGNGNNYLTVLPDGTPAVCDNTGTQLNAANDARCTAGTDYLVMQDDGNVVIHTSAGSPVWSSAANAR
jgi:serine/threonine protein kinase